MHLFVGQAHVRWTNLPVWKFALPVPALASDFAPLLGGVVFLGEACLRSGLDYGA